MAYIVARATGNWSATTTWNGGVVPTSVDDVYSNTFNVTMDVNANCNTLRNTSYQLLRYNPILTSNTAPSGVASASTTESATYEAWKAFNGVSVNDSDSWRAAAGTTTGWVAYEFTASVVISRYRITSTTTTANTNPFSWTFEGFNGTSWVVLHTVTANNIALFSTYDSGQISNATAYQSYRLNVSAVNGGTQLRVGELELFLRGEDIGATAGGQFILSSPVTVNVTGGDPLRQGSATTLISITNTNTTTPATLNFLNQVNSYFTSGTLIAHSSVGRATINAPYIGGVNIPGTHISKSSSGILNINAILVGANGSPTSSTVLTSTGGGTINIVGDVIAPTSTVSNSTISTSSTVTVNLTGNISASTGSTGSNAISQIGTLNITGNVTGSSVVPCISQSSGFCTVTGNVSAVSAPAISSAGGISCTVTGNVSSGSGSSCISLTNSGATCTVIGNLIANGQFQPIFSQRFRMSFGVPTNMTFATTVTPKTLYTEDSFPNLPTVSDVRSGTAFGPGLTLIGSLAVPSPSNVLAGVATDNTVGTYSTTPALIANEIFTRLVSDTSFNTTGSFGKLVKDNLDATVSSRLASASYVAPDNTGISNIKLKTDNLPANPASESTLQDVKTNTDLIPATI